MTKTLSEVRGSLPKRAQKVSGPDFLFIVNHSIKNDIQNDIYTAFTDEFRDTIEITILDGVYSYDIPDMFEVELVKDSSGIKFLPLNFSNSAIDTDVRKKYKQVGSAIQFQKNLIDSGSIAVGSIIYVDYVKVIPELEDETGDLPYSSSLQDKLFPVYVAGVAFYSFSDRKKLTDRDLAFNKYESAKLNVFSVF